MNEELEIIHTRGNVNLYLKLAPGRASLSLLKMAREGLLMELRNAIGRAKKDDIVVGKRKPSGQGWKRKRERPRKGFAEGGIDPAGELRRHSGFSGKSQ